jgi:hypothetical protein
MTESPGFLLCRAFDVRDIVDAGDIVESIVAEGATVIGATFVACRFDLEWMSETSCIQI